MNRVDKIFMITLSLAIIILLLSLWLGEEDVAMFGLFFVVLSSFSWLIYSAWFNPESKAKELRKSANKDLESGNLISAKIKFKQLGEEEIVKEIDTFVDGNTIQYNVTQGEKGWNGFSTWSKITLISLIILVILARGIIWYGRSQTS